MEINSLVKIDKSEINLKEISNGAIFLFQKLKMSRLGMWV